MPQKFEGANFPVELRPGEEVIFAAAPLAPMRGESVPRVLFDVSDVEVLPTPEAVWQAILDPNVPAEYLRTITVKTFREMFTPPQDRPENQIMALVVEFERGDTVELNGDKLELRVVIHLPISD